MNREKVIDVIRSEVLEIVLDASNNPNSNIESARESIFRFSNLAWKLGFHTEARRIESILDLIKKDIKYE